MLSPGSRRARRASPGDCNLAQPAALLRLFLILSLALLAASSQSSGGANAALADLRLMSNSLLTLSVDEVR